jgi:hypothetical protein
VNPTAAANSGRAANPSYIRPYDAISGPENARAHPDHDEMPEVVGDGRS